MPHSTKRPLIKIYLAPRETGWAYDLGDGLAEIANIPCSGRFNLMDVVTLTKSRGSIPRAKVLVKRVFERRCLLQYDRKEQFTQLEMALKRHKCACEGLLAPSRGKRGWMTVAHPASVDPTSLARRLGIPQ